MRPKHPRGGIGRPNSTVLRRFPIPQAKVGREGSRATQGGREVVLGTQDQVLKFEGIRRAGGRTMGVSIFPIRFLITIAVGAAAFSVVAVATSSPW
jgi:hypothetical protein